ncbi:hypothetical protein ACHHYP_12292 [Achlya hypogyna]|uniref:Uncharacterized protein n=1 Tax=Achlya hypogyna TaxID=1202772 RepID=A0A1V9YHD0_ACHHY|nr:hypothetical protein ACHHYP_12292 [Achlya hypogyna]
MEAPATATALWDELEVRKKEFERLRNRKKQQRHRERLTAERDALQAEVMRLTHVLTTAARRREAETFAVVKAALIALRAKYTATRHTSQTMITWVTAMIPQPGTPMGWSKLTLMADPTTRKLGLDWFTQHMYHNTDRILAYSGLPSAGSVSDAVLVDAVGGHVDIVGRIQTDYALPLEVAYDALRGRIWSMLRGDMSEDLSEFMDTEVRTRAPISNPRQ